MVRGVAALPGGLRQGEGGLVPLPERGLELGRAVSPTLIFQGCMAGYSWESEFERGRIPVGRPSQGGAISAVAHAE